jgi:hypothetical protein
MHAAAALTRLSTMRNRSSLLVVALALVPSAVAQVFTPPSATVPHGHDTGLARATGAGVQREVVHQFTVTQSGVDWMRLYFADVLLAGDVLAGNGAQLRLTSHQDAAEQLLDGLTLQQWQNSSAYFNGDTVEVEVLAFPGTGDSRVVMRGLEIGLPMPHFSQCGPVDDRVLSTDPRSARLLPIGCTGWLIADCAGCFLTAGHCQGNITVVQFNVPLSSSTGSLVNPPPQHQYAVDPLSLQGNGGLGVGNDWAYFGTFANSTSGLTATAAQGPGFVLAAPPPVGGNDIRITGYGTDNTPSTHNQVQQTHVGPLVTSSSTTVQYQTDTTGGNSGSPVIWEQTGQAVGIHTHGGCTTSGTGQNSGTSYSRPELQAALASPLGICAGGIGSVDVPSLVAPGTPAQVSMTVAGSVVAGTATLHWRRASGQLFQSEPMTSPSAGVYVASLPGFDCVDDPEYYFSVQTAACGQQTSPAAGPNGPYSVAVGVAAITFEDDFETNLGWTTAATATTGQWQRGVPVNDPGYVYDPATDGDGSGSCYLTQNTAGNSDVDNGSVTLTSPLVDRSTGGDLSYWYYLELTNTSGVDALAVDVSSNGGTSWNQVRRHTTSSGGWVRVTVTAQELQSAGVVPSATTRVRFIANDDNPQSIVEAAVDGVVFGSVSCDPTAIGSSYCMATANSTGATATIRANGDLAVVANDVLLTAEQLPISTVGYFLVAPNQGFVPNAGGSAGNLCLGAPIGRYAGNVLGSGASGAFALQIDLTSLPQPTGSVAAQAGQTWNFQAWYRDVVLGFSTSNLTNGTSLTFQ